MVVQPAVEIPFAPDLRQLTYGRFAYDNFPGDRLISQLDAVHESEDHALAAGDAFGILLRVKDV